MRPDPRSAFDDMWSQEPSVRTKSMDAVIVIDPADELPKDELTRILEARGNPM